MLVRASDDEDALPALDLDEVARAAFRNDLDAVLRASGEGKVSAGPLNFAGHEREKGTHSKLASRNLNKVLQGVGDRRRLLREASKLAVRLVQVLEDLLGLAPRERRPDERVRLARSANALVDGPDLRAQGQGSA